MSQGGRIGVLLVNLGTPDGADPASVRRYLAEFLSDPRVVEIPRAIWLPILYGAVLTTRPAKSAKAYAKVWQDGESPLRAITRAQAEALRGVFGPNVEIDWAMRYGQPSIGERLTALSAKGCDRLLIAPLYPQYSAATTASVMDKVFEILGRERAQPALRTLPPYFDASEHIDALTASVESGLAALDFAPDALLATFHGLPQRAVDKGDPYERQCRETARRLAARIPVPLRISFQSRFGRAKWLEPATDKVLAALPAEGIRKLAVVAPGFAADCVETLEEISIRGRATFEAARGERFAYLPCLNASPPGVAMLKALIGRELEGWLDRA